MDKMEPWEIDAIIENIEYYESQSWERNRLLLTTLLNMFSKKKLDTQDVMVFPWEKETVDTTPLPDLISTDDIERLRQKSKLFTNE